MGETHYGNAMTEVALALAMAFFSIMVLAMVSMGAGDFAAATKPDEASAVVAALAPSAPETEAAARLRPSVADTLVIYHGGAFLDRSLQPLDPAGMTFSGRVILALDPGLSMAEALAARARINTRNLVVSVLDETWLDRVGNGR